MLIYHWRWHNSWRIGTSRCRLSLALTSLYPFSPPSAALSRYVYWFLRFSYPLIWWRSSLEHTLNLKDTTCAYGTLRLCNVQSISQVKVERCERQSRLKQKSFVCVQMSTSVWLSQEIDGEQFCTVNILFEVKQFSLKVALMCVDYDTSRSVPGPLIRINCKWKADLWSPVFLYVLGCVWFPSQECRQDWFFNLLVSGRKKVQFLQFWKFLSGSAQLL